MVVSGVVVVGVAVPGLAVPGIVVPGVALPGYLVLGGLEINLPLKRYTYSVYFSFALAETKAAANSKRKT